MKTTVEISDVLLRQAKKLASDGGTTLRDLIESGLRKEIASRQQPGYRLVDESWGGSGLQPGVDRDDWGTITDLTYRDRGG